MDDNRESVKERGEGLSQQVFPTLLGCLFKGSMGLKKGPLRAVSVELLVRTLLKILRKP